MKEIKLTLMIFFLSPYFISCSDWPRDTIAISDKYYCIREERGFAFTSTVFDYEFYQIRKWWWDKKLGNIIDRSEVPVDFLQVINDDRSDTKRIIIIKENKSILDTTLNFDKTFYISIGYQY